MIRLGLFRGLKPLLPPKDKTKGKGIRPRLTDFDELLRWLDAEPELVNAG
ncbi:MAG: hypothetical protein ACLQM6_07485 [Acidobacteriaceae bacterium]